MSELILAVDDDPRILKAYQRALGDRFRILGAEGAAYALSVLKSQDVAVVLSDLCMPDMDGIELLSEVKRLQPDAVRVMISGHADLTSAVSSIRKAGVFRLLLKPCETDELEECLKASLDQHRLVRAEKELLQNTLNGAVRALSDILGVLDPDAFGQTQARSRLMRGLAEHFEQPPWEFEIAAMLAEIGRATLPAPVLEKLSNGRTLSAPEKQLIEKVPEFSHHLLAHIPRLENVAKIVLYQAKNLDGTGFPTDGTKGPNIPLGSRCLRAVNSFLALARRGVPLVEAIDTLKVGPEHYDPKVVAALFAKASGVTFDQPTAATGPAQVSISDLPPNAVLLADITTRDGMVVLGSGVRLTAAHIQRIRNFASLNPLTEPILVDLSGCHAG
jgi:response regulator RpfG family c-di-GMP phosphodiesterase